MARNRCGERVDSCSMVGFAVAPFLTDVHHQSRTCRAKRSQMASLFDRVGRVKLGMYGEELKEFESSGNLKLQDRLVSEAMYDIRKIVLADNLDFYVSAEIVKLRESLREKFRESRKRIHERGEVVARLESANALYKWDKLIRDAEQVNRAAEKELRKEHAELDAKLNRPKIAKLKYTDMPSIAPKPRFELMHVSMSLLATFFITAGFFRAVQTSILETGITASIAQLGFLTLTVLLVFTSSLSMTLPRN